MHDEFEMSMMGELSFFFGLQIQQMEDGIIFNQSKYIKEMLKKFGLEDSKPTKMQMSTEIKLTKDDEPDFVESTKYRGIIMSLSNQDDYKQTKVYKPKIYSSKVMDQDVRKMYITIKDRLFHEGRFVTPSFIEANKMLLLFQEVGLESFLTFDEPYCPRGMYPNTSCRYISFINLPPD
uniref:Retrovirus-related Pol polyprotein from transposon TNT 1-94 n=1 Tax=Tanacetum cinerariifolium TaxID=118510 RepID=A0A6L2KVI3_TANCI|nr:retrovirus-related Pol polyprotein from transposon TNT 1-94 [Tanacetum cinerariifolium]